VFFQGSRYKSVSRAMIFTQGLLAQSSKRNTPVPHHRQRYDVSCLATQSTVEGLSSRSQACSLSFGRVVARVGQYRLSTAPAAPAALGAFAGLALPAPSWCIRGAPAGSAPRHRHHFPFVPHHHHGLCLIDGSVNEWLACSRSRTIHPSQPGFSHRLARLSAPDRVNSQ